MPAQQRLRNFAGRVWPKYRYVAWAAVGLKGFGRRQVAFVGPPEAVLFCELPALFYLHFPSHRLQSSSASRFKFVRLLGGAATCGRVVSDLGSSRVVTATWSTSRGAHIGMALGHDPSERLRDEVR